MENNKMKIAYVVTERNGRSFWNRCGVAFVNGDGSLNVKLESIPVSGELQIRDYVPREDAVPPIRNTYGHNEPFLAEAAG